MSRSGFTSGEELLRARNRDQTLLPSGEKVEEAVGSWLEGKMVEARLQEHQTLLQEPKIARKDQLCTGEWLPESQMVQVTRPGKFWHHMGVETDIGKCLYPEEAVYLIDTGELEVVYDGLPLSLQQAQATLLQEAHHLDQYCVYSHLTRTGCKVVRHQPHLIFTKYEKEIRIDQHQSSRKGTKLKLGSDKDSGVDNSTQNTSQPQPVDVAMEELYACLGEAAVNPLTVEKDETGSSVGASIVTSDGKKKETGKTTSTKTTTTTNQDTLRPHEIRRRELIDLFPTMLGKESMHVDVESADLLPNNSIPLEKTYKIAIENLEYYSLFVSRHHYHYENQSHRNWGNKDSWNNSRNGRWGSNTDNSNWQSRDYNHRSHDYRERGNRWQQSQPRRGSHAMNREDRNGRWGSANDSDWRHRRDPEPDMGSRDRHGGSDHNMGFRDNHSDSSHLQDDQIDFSVWPEWKKRHRRKNRQQGRDTYPSVIVKLRTRVSSWKEYKRAVAEMTAKKQLTEGGTKVLWEGRTIPLLTPPTTSSSTSSNTPSNSKLLSSISLDAGVTDMSVFSEKVPQEARMKVLYDVYLPTVTTYKKSNPPSPSKRIVVMRDGNMPNPGQILEVASRFVDGVAVACAVVTGGEVRLYTFSPVTLPPPQPLS